MLQTLSFVLVILLAFAKGDELDNETCKKRLQGPVIDRYANDVKNTLALKVVYEKVKEVKCGNFLGFLTTILVPTVSYDVKGACNETTVLFIGIPTKIYDTDAIVGYPYRHWLVNNVPANVLKQGFYGQSGDIKTDYLFPLNPFSDHYYTFLVYCQENHIETGKREDGILLERASFQVKDYAENNKLGDPLAINYFVSTLVDGIEIPPAPPEGSIFDLPTAKGSNLGK